MHDRAAGDVLADQRDGGTLTRYDERQGAAQDFADNNHDLALAGRRLGSAAINALIFSIGGLQVAARIHAVDFDRAGKLWLIWVVNLGTNRLAELVGEHKRRLVLHVEITAKL